MENASIFPLRMKQLMENGEKKTTQKALADTIGVKRQSIAQYISGTVQPPITTAMAIADYFGVSLDYLTGRSDRKSSDIDVIKMATIIGFSDESILEMQKLPKKCKAVLDCLVADDALARTVDDIELAASLRSLYLEVKEDTVHALTVQRYLDTLYCSIGEGFVCAVVRWLQEQDLIKHTDYSFTCYSCKKGMDYLREAVDELSDYVKVDQFPDFKTHLVSIEQED